MTETSNLLLIKNNMPVALENVSDLNLPWHYHRREFFLLSNQKLFDFAANEERLFALRQNKVPRPCMSLNALPRYDLTSFSTASLP